jgi:hypothetical protein
LPRLLGVLVDESVDALEQRVFEALLDRGAAPGLLDLLRGGAGPCAFEPLGVVDEPLGGVGAAVEQHVLDFVEQLRLGISSYTSSMPALTMPMSMPALMAW